ncbi:MULTISPECIES: BREX-1 system adenine-specific DNA-methyltransferase PglX [Caproicibacterium]|uniref:site-specific DNA-methyltransferase (adenine-specific) n=1 Tax=Caproicibacterium argilliputei TaxID=3030016 RepID=A0AA97H287_9FIRM|nr:BREX-1 system adenine-specific DNA-methyltransferase PglX [Caproicibacterium argilliputei]WOC33298.1 BREX-1 system adenine-specific DNA-methyltransferase PglX [Caproicibacterium argilliputei]
MEKAAVRALAQKVRADLEQTAHLNLQALRGPRLPEEAGLQQDLLLRKASLVGEAALCRGAAYRFFMQLAGIRFLEVNGCLPLRVLTPAPSEELPEILAHWLRRHEDTLDRDDLYTRLVLAECTRLHGAMPDFFPAPACDDLLLSLHCTRGAAFLFRNELPENNWRDNVEIIGWLYQYYHLEEKSRAIDLYRGAVKMHDVPAATQFFTTDWVVQYMVQNTLGRIWLESRPDSRLRTQMPYYLDTPQKTTRPVMEPTQLRLLDPCMGSGHILVYAFDLLLNIYAECGYSAAEAAPLILQHNLWGLDLDDHSRQLTAFALLMKAHACSPDILRKHPVLHLCAMRGSKGIARETLHYAANGSEALEDDLHRMVSAYRGAQQFGSLLHAPKVDSALLQARFAEIRQESWPGNLFKMEARRKVLEQLEPLFQQTGILAGTYDAVVTNPPYLNHMAKPLRKFVDANWPKYNNDLFAVFMVRNFDFCKPNGYCGFMTPFVWMFIKSYVHLRRFLADKKSVSSLVQLEYSAFEEATVPVCTFVLQNKKEEDPGRYLKLTGFSGGMVEMGRRVAQAAAHPGSTWDYEARLSDFRQIPDSPFAYWAGGSIARVFRQGRPLGADTAICNGLFTCSNQRFLRLWWEVEPDNIDFSCTGEPDCRKSLCRWFPYNKGGAYRKWYGNQEWVVDFADFGAEIRNYRVKSGQSAAMPGRQHYFQESLSWGFVSSSKFSVRAYPAGFVFDIAGSSLFPKPEDRLYRLGFLGSSTAFELLQVLNPTLNCQVGDISRLPILEAKDRSGIEKLVAEAVALCREDWDENETSWNFIGHPLLQAAGSTLEQALESRRKTANTRCQKLQTNEEAINRHFATLYGTGAPVKTAPDDLSVTPADPQRDAQTLLSFFVGVFFGRFPCTFWRPPQDRPVLLLEEAPRLFTEFLEARFGQGAADALAPLLGKGTTAYVLKRWFTRTFFRSHCQLYRKRPIYWQTCCGKPALLYYHSNLTAAVRFLATLSPKEKKLQALAAHPPVFDRNDGIPANFAKLQAILRSIR